MEEGLTFRLVVFPTAAGWKWEASCSDGSRMDWPDTDTLPSSSEAADKGVYWFLDWLRNYDRNVAKSG